MLKGILRTDLFFCNHLGVMEEDEKDIMNFTIRNTRGMGLLNYIQKVAFADEDNGVMRTYIVRDIRTSELVGYFSLKTGLISLNERTIEVNDKNSGISIQKTLFDTLPGVELANFAINDTYIRRHPDMKGVGFVIFESFILPIIRKTSEHVGLKILYLFSLPYDELIERYKQYGFSRLKNPYEDELHRRLKPQYDQSCKFMYQIL